MNLEPLTPREKEVAELLQRGFTNRQIAIELGNSIRTIETHRANIYAKWHITSLRELIEIMEPLTPIQKVLIIVAPPEIINDTTSIMIGEL